MCFVLTVVSFFILLDTAIINVVEAGFWLSGDRNRENPLPGISVLGRGFLLNYMEYLREYSRDLGSYTMAELLDLWLVRIRSWQVGWILILW